MVLISAEAIGQIPTGAAWFNIGNAWKPTTPPTAPVYPADFDTLTNVDWGDQNDPITYAIYDLGFTKGSVMTRIDPLNNPYYTELSPELPLSLPAGFELYTGLQVQASPQCPDCLPTGRWHPYFVWEWHTEYAPHYTGAQTGESWTEVGATWYPNVLPTGNPNSWRLNASAHSAGIAVQSPSKAAEEVFDNDLDYWVKWCVIRLKANLSSVSGDPVIFTYRRTGPSGTSHIPYRKDSLDDHSNEFFDLIIPNVAMNMYPTQQIYWEDVANAEIFIDKIMYFTEDARKLLNGEYDAELDTMVNRLERASNSTSVSGIDWGHELGYLRYRTVQYVTEHFRDRGYRKLNWAWGGNLLPPSDYHYYFLETMDTDGQDYYNINPYPFGWNGTTADDANAGAASQFQDEYQANYIQFIQTMQYSNRDRQWNHEMHTTVQTFQDLRKHTEVIEGHTVSFGNWYRYPSNHEVLLQVNTALCYGSREIWYWNFRGAVQDWGLPGGCSQEVWDDTVWADPCTEDVYDGILDRYGNIHRQEVYDEIKKINCDLAGGFGSALSALTWKDAFSSHATASIPQWGMTHAGNITDVSTYLDALEGADTSFVEVGYFQDATNNDYLLAVNRRASRAENLVSERDIRITFDNESDFTLEEKPTGYILVLPPDGTSSRMHSPAEAKLFKVSSGTWADEKSINDTVIVFPSATLTIDNEIALGANCYFLVKNGGTVTLTENGQLTLNGAVVECQGTGKIEVVDPNAIVGTGTLVAANIEIATELVIPSGSDIMLTGGGTIKCESLYEENDLVVNGELTFTGSGAHYDFDQSYSVDDINVGSNGVLTFSGNIFVDCLTDINVWDDGQLIIEGVDDNNRCNLSFRQNAGINCSSVFDCRYANLGACDDDEWDGILIVGVGSSIYMTNTWITDIYCDPVYQGTGVHLYQSSNSDNFIGYSKIMRYEQPDKLGDAVFLQPEQGTGSALEIQCLETDSAWYTGLTSVGSRCTAQGLQSKRNHRGVGAHSMSNDLNLDESLLWNNTYEGLYGSADSAQSNWIKFGYWMYDSYGDNRIENNGDVQVFLDGHVTLDGGKYTPSTGTLNWRNCIGHSSLNVTRVRVAGGAKADLEYNYWSTSQPTAALFDIINGTCDWNPFTQQCDAPDELTCFTLGKTTSTIALYDVNSSSLGLYARAGRMNEVYSYIGTRTTAATTASEKRTVIAGLLAAEVAHVREYPDSLSASSARFTAFLRNGQNSFGGIPEMLAGAMAEYYTWMNMPDSADIQFTTIENSYKNTYVYKSTLEARLFNAFNKRDSLGIDGAIAEMVATGFDSSEIRRAYSERRAYYRCRKNRMLPKKAEYVEVNVPVAKEIMINVSPNPANTEVIVSCMIQDASFVEVKLRTIDGRELRTLHSGYRAAGLLALNDQIQDLKPGAYIYSIESRYFHGYAKLLVVR